MTYADTFKEIRIHIESKMGGTYWTTNSVKHTYTNKEFDSGTNPTITDSWLRFDISPGESDTLEIGRSAVGERLGNVKVSIFTPKTPTFNEATAENHATQVESDFRLLHVNGVDFREPFTELINFETDQWVHHRTVIPWRTFIGE